MTNKQRQQRYEIGMVGLGAMGRNLLLNMADHGFSVAGYDKDQAKVEVLRKESAERNIRGVPHQSFPPEATLDWQPSLLAMSIHPGQGGGEG
jgi:UDP-N-acetyl-D-mannosaminuronate dehydrogenase